MSKKINFYTIPGARSQAVLNKVQDLIGNANIGTLYGITLSSGKKNTITDVDGNVYLDCLSGASASNIGYENKTIVEAYAKQASQLQHSCFFYSFNEPALRLAEKLCEITPGRFDKRVLLGLSGSDSCDAAVKIIREYSQIMTVIHFKNDYHGSTGLSQEASNFGTINEGLYPQNGYFLELPYPTDSYSSHQVLQTIEKLFIRQSAGGILAEAIQGDAGVLVPAGGFFKQLYALCKKHNKILAIDEVQSGMGRTGKWWAIDHEGIEPDLLITAKALGGGYAPISALIGRSEMVNILHSGQHLFTFGGHPPSAAVAYEVISWIEKHDLIKEAEQKGSFLIEKLQELVHDYPDIVLEVRGRGLMVGVEINVSNFELLARVLAFRCVECGLYVGFVGVRSNVIRIEPPLTITKKQIKVISRTLKYVIGEFAQGNTPQETIEKAKKFSIGI